jgi:hypothetical protein
LEEAGPHDGDEKSASLSPAPALSLSLSLSLSRARARARSGTSIASELSLAPHGAWRVADHDNFVFTPTESKISRKSQVPRSHNNNTGAAPVFATKYLEETAAFALAARRGAEG